MALCNSREWKQNEMAKRCAETRKSDMCCDVPFSGELRQRLGLKNSRYPRHSGPSLCDHMLREDEKEQKFWFN